MKYALWFVLRFCPAIILVVIALMYSIYLTFPLILLATANIAVTINPFMEDIKKIKLAKLPTSPKVMEQSNESPS